MLPPLTIYLQYLALTLVVEVPLALALAGKRFAGERPLGKPVAPADTALPTRFPLWRASSSRPPASSRTSTAA